MARLYYVDKSRKAQICSVCNCAIPEGSRYQYTTPRYRGKIVAHIDCRIPHSMTSSSKMAAIYDEVELFNREDYEGMAANLYSLAETVRDVSEQYQESADNMGEYFQGSSQVEDLEDKAQQLEGWADDIETAAEEVEDKFTDLADKTAKVEMLYNELDNLDEETHEKKYNDLQSEIEDLEYEIEDLECEIEDLECEIEEAVAIIDDCPV